MIVFTDLDGTLLDHETYRFDAALPALEALTARGVPLVLATSKTAAEIGPIRQALGCDVPAIVENGGGIVWAGDAAVASLDDYSDIRATLDALPPRLRAMFRGFGDMDEAGIASLTGLSEEQAGRARQRRHSEPGLFSGTSTEHDKFLACLEEHGLRAVQGGRFLTVGRDTSKSRRMQEVRTELERRLGRPLAPVVALGDAENDREMIEAADIGVVVANPAHAPLPPLAGEAEGRIRRTTLPGPAGWNAAVLGILGEYAPPAHGGASG
ncbi:HAD-IIB family hydrolase [Aquibium sp. LZ166]|uniref:HAD-IIB family hydrolase n=1 Tax=Aquibium pacificus TaxID=3153579 RepID=A0ABV3SGT3_9HYPH